MSSKVGKFLSSLDQFGVLSQLSFFNNDLKFKTIYGGILSIFIYLLGIMYFLYLMTIWSTNQIQPSVTIQQQYNPNPRQFEIKQVPYVFGLSISYINDEIQGGEFNIIQSLKQKGDIFMTYTDTSANYNDEFIQNDNDFVCYEPNTIYDYSYQKCINLQDKSNLYDSILDQSMLQIDSKNRQYDTQVTQIFAYCDPNGPINNGKCLNFEDQTKLYNQYVNWRLTLLTQDIDLKTGEIITIPQDYYFTALPMQNNQTLNVQLKLRQTTFIIDSGILFPSKQNITVIKSIELITQQTSFKLYNDIAQITYFLDRQEEIIHITHPKLGLILADLGSIIQGLLTFGLIMNHFNAYLMQFKIDEALIEIYFPQINLFEFIYDWRGNISQIFFRKQALQKADYEVIKIFREKSGQHVRKKLNYFNMLNEMSQLQKEQQLKIPRDQPGKSRRSGYKMDQSLKEPGKFDQGDEGLISSQQGPYVNHQGSQQNDEDFSPQIQSSVLDYRRQQQQQVSSQKQIHEIKQEDNQFIIQAPNIFSNINQNKNIEFGSSRQYQQYCTQKKNQKCDNSHIVVNDHQKGDNQFIIQTPIISRTPHKLIEINENID